MKGVGDNWRGISGCNLSYEINVLKREERELARIERENSHHVSLEPATLLQNTTVREREKETARAICADKCCIQRFLLTNSENVTSLYFTSARW